MLINLLGVYSFHAGKKVDWIIIDTCIFAGKKLVLIANLAPAIIRLGMNCAENNTQK